MKIYKAKQDSFNEVSVISGKCHYVIPGGSVWREIGTVAGFITLQNVERFGDRIMISMATLNEIFDII